MSNRTSAQAVTRSTSLLLLGALLFVPVTMHAQHVAVKDDLPSWRDGAAKRSVLAFIREVTDKSSPKYVKPEERIATFDDDGTLWTEWPRQSNQVQMAFARQRVKQMEKAHRPNWDYLQPFKAILHGDENEIASVLDNFWNKLDLLRATNGGMTVDEFGETVRRFLATARHPTFKVPYTEVAYVPMVELLGVLRAKGFKIYIVTTSGADFIRELSERLFGVPRECVIGSTPEYEYEETPDGGYLFRTANVALLNDGGAKAKSIQLHIGRRPILVAGNNDGDLAMMGLAAGGNKPVLNLVVRHDDPDREFAYDENTAKVTKAANTHGWTTVSMKRDFKTVFSFTKR